MARKWFPGAPAAPANVCAPLCFPQALLKGKDTFDILSYGAELWREEVGREGGSEGGREGGEGGGGGGGGGGEGRDAWRVDTTRKRGSTSGPNLWKHRFYELFPPDDGGKPRDVLQEDQADMEVPAPQQVEQQWYDMGTGDGEGKTAYTIIEVNSD